jgi:hypothetical protein
MPRAGIPAWRGANHGGQQYPRSAMRELFSQKKSHNRVRRAIKRSE